MLQGLEPVQQGGISLPGWFRWNPLFWGRRDDALFQSSPLGAKSDFGVPVGCFQAGVAQPRTDNIHFDTGFQEMDGSAVAPHVRGYCSSSTIRSLFDNLSRISANNLVDSESGQGRFRCASEDCAAW